MCRGLALYSAIIDHDFDRALALASSRRGQGATICCIHRTEHAHTATKGHLTTNVATKCAKNESFSQDVAMTKSI